MKNAFCITTVLGRLLGLRRLPRALTGLLIVTGYLALRDIPI
jgi:hypothetical protein